MGSLSMKTLSCIESTVPLSASPPISIVSAISPQSEQCMEPALTSPSQHGTMGGNIQSSGLYLRIVISSDTVIPTALLYVSIRSLTAPEADTRKRFTSLYSMSSLVHYEPFVDHCADLFVNRLAEFANSKETFNLGHWFQCYAFDVIGNITFGERFGMSLSFLSVISNHR